ncbi:MAG: hypothetical protein ACXVIS_10490 [Halobacteriota archaeon]
MRSRRCDRAEGGLSSTASLIGLFNGSARRRFGGLGQSSEQLGVARFSTKSAASLALYARDKRGGLDA